MAKKSNISATYFAQKKLLGKAHTSNLKVDGEELIGSNIQTSTELIFGESIPESPTRTLYVLQSATGSSANTVEYVQFSLNVLTGTTYDANDTGGGAGSDSGESSQTSGPHTYKFVLTSDYEASSSNPSKGGTVFKNGKIVHETLGKIQIVPPFFSQTAPNPYIVKIYKDDGSGGVGDEIPLLDNIDWNVDYYNGILFLQDYSASKVPAHARAFVYVGKMAEEVISSGSSSLTAGDGIDIASSTVSVDLKSGGGLKIDSTELAIDDSLVATLSGSTFRGQVTVKDDLVVSGTIISNEFHTMVVSSSIMYRSGSTKFGDTSDDTHFFTGSASFTQGMSGSLTRLTDGKSYLVAGSNVTITSSSNGQVTVTSADTNTTYTAGDGLDLSTTTFSLDLKSSGGLKIDSTELAIDDSIVATTSGSQFRGNVGVTGSVEATAGLSGSLTKLTNGRSYLVAGNNVSVTSASNGSVTIAATDTNTTYTAGDGLDLSTTTFSLDLKSAGGLKIDSTELSIDDSYVATLTGSQFRGNIGVTGSLGATTGLSGSLTRLTDGKSYLVAGSNVTITSASNGQVTITGTDTNTTYTAGNGLDLSGTEFALDLKSDGGLKIDSTELTIDDSLVATLSGSTFKGKVTVNDDLIVSGTIVANEFHTMVVSSSIMYRSGSTKFGDTSDDTHFFTGSASFTTGMSGSLTRLTDGKSYLVAGNNVTISSSSNGQVTVTSTDTNTTYTAGDGLDLSTTTFSLDLKSGGGLKIDSTELAINDSVVATISGSQFRGNVGATGSIEATKGLSGSLTQLTDGKSYLVAGNNVTISSASNGQVTVTSTDTNTTYTAGDGLDLSTTTFSLDLKSGGGLKIDSTELALDDSLVATLSGSTFKGKVTVNDDLIVSGTIVANEFHTMVVSSSIMYRSGSTKFGDTSDDTHFFTGSASFTSGISGSLTRLVDGKSYLVAGNNVTITSASNGQVTVAAAASSPAGANTQIQYNNGGSFGASSAFTFTGTEVELNAASPKITLRRSNNSQNSNLSFEGAAGAVGASLMLSGATTNDLVLSTHDGTSLVERVRIGSNLPNIAVDLTGTLRSTLGLSGSLTRLIDGKSYLVAGNNVTITSASNGQVTVAATNTNTTYTAGNGLDLGGTEFALDLKSGGGLKIDSTELAIDDSLVATLSGSTFRGQVTINDDLVVSGSIIANEFHTMVVSSSIMYRSGSTKFGDTSDDTHHFTGSVDIAGTLKVDGNVTFNESGADKDFRVESSGKTGMLFVDGGNDSVGIGTTTPGAQPDEKDDLVIGDHTGNRGMTIASANTGIGTIRFARTTNANDGEGWIDYSGNTNKMRFGTNGLNTRMTIDSAGKVGIGTGSPSTELDVDGTIKGSALSGSLTRLSDGSSYLVAGSNITITSASSGQVTIAGLAGDITGVTAGTGLTGGGNSGAVTLNINDSVVATISGSQFRGNVGVTGSLGATTGLSGSLTQLTDGKSYLVAGNNVTITSASNGQVTIAASASGGSINVTSGSTSVSTVTRVDFTDGFVVNDSQGGIASVTSSIGKPEDGAYTDGLFTDFLSTTPIGTAIDRFNEVLKALAPEPAPALDNINALHSGSGVYLSFGSSNNLASSNPAYTSVAASAGVGSAVDVNALYTVVTASNNIRLGVFDGDTHITGILNSDVAYNSQGNSIQNYPKYSFGEGDSGVVRLTVNGSTIKTVDLTLDPIGSGSSGLGSGSHIDANGSGFKFFSAPSTGTLSNGNAFTSFKHRTGKFFIASGTQRRGWNYARVQHIRTGSTQTTNYIEWVNDDDPNTLTAEGNSLAFVGSGSIHLSGIEYFRSGTATYKTRVKNAYRNVYDTNNITFTTSNSAASKSGVTYSISAQSKPTINTGAGENHTKTLHLTGSATVSANYFLSGSLTAGVSVTHPLKSNLSNSGQSSTTGILMYDLANSSTALVETFRREDYRIVSGAYTTQASLYDASNKWDSKKHMTSSNGAHSNGLQFYDDKLYSPTQALNSGDFRDDSEGGTLNNSPLENPNYSGETGQRTFYRWFKNETGSTKYDLSIAINGSGGTIVPAATALNSSRLRAFVKFPSDGSRSTGWLDLATEFVLDSYDDNDGAHTANGSLSFDNTLSATNYVTLGTVGIGNNEYIGLRIEADASWTGNISEITVSFGGGTGTITAIPDLDDIDCNEDGTDCKLSFGASKSITGYTNVSTTAGFSAVDINGTYQTAASSNNHRRSVFAFDTHITGDLNEDVTGDNNGSHKNHVANSFSDANSGSLKLEVNGSVIHTVEITGSYNLIGTGNPGDGAGSSLNSNGSGFTNISVWDHAEYNNGMPDYTEIYRTAKYKIHTADQRNGWNYARVIHTVAGSDRNTNYIEWVNDNDSSTMSADNVSMTNFSGSNNLFHLSGIKYYTHCTASLLARFVNSYRDVYSSDSSAIAVVNTSNVTVQHIVASGTLLTDKKVTASSTTMPSLSTTAGSELTNLNLTASLVFASADSLPENATSAAAALRVKHPLKSNVTTATQTKSSFMVFSASDNSNANTEEYFSGEKYRLISGSYTTQGQAGAPTGSWDSTKSVNDGGNTNYYSGLIIYDGHLVTPLTGGNSGDYRNVADGGSLQGPDGNMNYSSPSVGRREYFRAFKNNTTNDVAQVTITLRGNATIKALAGPNSGSLGANDSIHVECKVPGKTGWLDTARASSGAGNTSDGDGGLSGDLTAAVVKSGAENICTLNGETCNGTASSAEYVAIRITAHKNWTGYLDRITVAYE